MSVMCAYEVICILVSSGAGMGMSCMYRRISYGDRTKPLGAPLDIFLVREVAVQCCTCACLPEW